MTDRSDRESLNVGLIGFGLFGRHHARVIDTAPGARLAGIAARSPETRAQAAEMYPDARIEDDYRRLLEDPEVDLVDIVVPNDRHFEVARAALQQGKHVLLEKPMAVKLEHCEELVTLSQQSGKLLAVGHELRLSSLWGGVRDLIERGAIGRVQHVLIELSRFPYRPGSEGWRYQRDQVGSWILEEPIHFFDLARWYLRESGEPVSVYARANSRNESQPELRDNFTAIVNYPDNAYAVVSQTLAAFGHHQTAKVSGTEGAIWAWWSASDARSDQSRFGLQYGLGDDVHEVELDKPAGELLELADQFAAVIRCIHEGTEPPCTASDGRWSTALCLAAEVSVERGEPVRL